ncbi:MAG: hypothetical protein HY563_10180 [Ignavibacteriales bacterium]|nr:hypothetical protein [Ignavibacteriales bacterium]
MRDLSRRELQELLSLAADGTLDAERQRILDEYCRAHPEALSALKELRRLKHLLASQKKVAPNPFFRTRLLQVLEQGSEESRNLLPFPSKFVPLASALAIVIFIGLGITVFLQRGPLLQYLSETSSEVQQVYESSILKGSIIPLFTNIGNDDVLQYALFGTLPLDKNSDAALRVDEGSAEGYRIEVGLKAERQSTPQVTVNDLFEEVRPTPLQAVRIDSVLREARSRIAQAGFYAENNALAIDPEITQLNRRVLSRIVGVLGPVQRERLDNFLKKRNSVYGVAFEKPGAPPVPPVVRHVPGPDHRKDFIVITPDSFVITTLAFDMDSLRGPWAVKVHADVAEMHKRLEEFVRSQAKRVPPVPRVRTEGPVRIMGEGDVIRIEVGRRLVGEESELHRVVVHPRTQVDTFFQFEIRTGVPQDDRRPGEFERGVEIEVQRHLDSMMRHFREEQEEHLRQLREFDSLMAPPGMTRQRPRRGASVDSLK